MMAGCQPTVDYEHWMKNLPDVLHNLPLNQLAIPGSHNSFTYYLDKSAALSPCAPEVARYLTTLFGPLAKSIIHSWSVTQSLGVEDQLKAGIRYFDIRVGSRADTDELYAVHGLYGPTIDSCLCSLDKFLDSHPEEIVLLDFNHFYDMDSSAHHRLVDSLLHRFSSRMCPVMDMSCLTLRTLWDTGLQLVVFYHDHDSVEQHFQLWPGSIIPAFWHNKQTVDQLVEAVDAMRCKRPPTDFYVSQGVLTPDTWYIASHVGQNLRSNICDGTLQPFVDWLRRQTIGCHGVNIVTMDFVELTQFIPTVVALNYQQAASVQTRN
jgi:hypothetical protein